mgnify:CR=1 FL=1
MCGENGLEETMKKLTETHTHGDNVYLTQNATGWFVEVLSTNKGEGFVRLCKELNMDVTESIAFGLSAGGSAGAGSTTIASPCGEASASTGGTAGVTVLEQTAPSAGDGPSGVPGAT